MDRLTCCKECDRLPGLTIISASGESLQGWKQKPVSGKISHVLQSTGQSLGEASGSQIHRRCSHS